MYSETYTLSFLATHCMSVWAVHQKIILNPYLFHSAIQVRELTYITAHCQSGIYKVLRLSSCDENFERIFPCHTSYIQPNLCSVHVCILQQKGKTMFQIFLHLSPVFHLKKNAISLRQHLPLLLLVAQYWVRFLSLFNLKARVYCSFGSCTLVFLWFFP